MLFLLLRFPSAPLQLCARKRARWMERRDSSTMLLENRAFHLNQFPTLLA